MAYAAAADNRDAGGGGQVWTWRGRTGKYVVFEAKFSCRVNRMMNDGRCVLNRIPLAEPSSLCPLQCQRGGSIAVNAVSRLLKR